MQDALYCTRGHYIGFLIPSTYGTGPNQTHWLMRDSDSRPEKVPRFCAECGAHNMSACPHCQTPITPVGLRPAYCGGCGKPFPWTEGAIAAAREYTDEIEGLSIEDKTTLKETFIHLTMDVPESAVAASRFKRILKSVAPAARDILTKIIVDVLSQAGKKLIGG